jgi:hypothetical protein
MQSTYVDDQHRATASLVPEWPTAEEAQSNAAFADDVTGNKPTITSRMLRASARFSIAVLIGVGATLAWQSFGPSLHLSPVPTTKVAPDVQQSLQNVATPQSGALPQTAPPVAANIPELAQLEPMARDLAAMRSNLEQFAAKQDQIIQNMTTLQAAQQDIKQKLSSRASSQPLSDQPRKPAKPRSQPAQSPPASPAPVAQSPAQ